MVEVNGISSTHTQRNCHTLGSPDLYCRDQRRFNDSQGSNRSGILIYDIWRASPKLFGAFGYFRVYVQTVLLSVLDGAIIHIGPSWLLVRVSDLGLIWVSHLMSSLHPQKSFFWLWTLFEYILGSVSLSFSWLVWVGRPRCLSHRDCMRPRCWPLISRPTNL